ncbi:hypothetical protein Bca52824_071462 [Brassica carinata]|uniref:Uncharacterized protein n=1 Tax=Brassica carinata TaxID=52824 RepID=A0A8X7Q769_BRACI|nr:hypothetical protein Bca52824_071462 [Brassica carinata]
MPPSPQTSRSGSNSYPKTDDNPFDSSEPVTSPDPLLYNHELVSSPTLTLPADFRIPDSVSVPVPPDPEPIPTPNPTEPTEVQPRRLSNLEYFNQHLNVFGETLVTPA